MKYINQVLQTYENTKLIHYDKPEEWDSLKKKYLYDELSDKEVAGVLKGCMYVDNKLTQFFSNHDSHVAVIAATRQGKTTSYIIPTILSFIKQKIKKSMIISDPKGELYRLTAQTIREHGYKVKVINFRDYLHSETWNPLTPLFKKYRKAKQLELDAIDQVKNTIIKQIMDTEVSRLSPNSNIMTYNGQTYSTAKSLRGAVEKEAKAQAEKELPHDVKQRVATIMGEVANDIDSIALMCLPDDNRRKNSDPYWKNAARELCKGVLWGMLEDSSDEENPITEDTFSFNSLISITDKISASKESIDDNGYFSKRDPATSRAYKAVKNIILFNANSTASCVVSEFNAEIAMFKDENIRYVTCCNSFNIEELTEEPTVIFIEYRDELKSHYRVISLFVQHAYTYLIHKATQMPNGMLSIPFYMILDEFGNFPHIKDMDTVISCCAGRNIFFILAIQSYAQLINVYGVEVAEIIKDNLNVHVFLGSNNPATLEAFSKECGMITRVKLTSALNGNGENIENYDIETVAAVPQSKLAHFEAGECIITEANCGYVMYSKLERYYKINEMNSLPRADINDYKSDIDIYSPKYTYKCHVTATKDSIFNRFRRF